jgi:hypothetical protein
MHFLADKFGHRALHEEWAVECPGAACELQWGASRLPESELDAHDPAGVGDACPLQVHAHLRGFASPYITISRS